MPFRWSWATALVVGVVVHALAPSAWAAPCGGGIVCACGDTVVTNTKLDYDLGPCDETGLKVVSRVVLDCANHTIVGTNIPGPDGKEPTNSDADFGIHLTTASNATVRRCRVGGFGRAIRIDGGSDNLLHSNQTFVEKIVAGEPVLYSSKYGIDLSNGTSRNMLKRNLVQYGRDEGIHLGGSSYNSFVANEIIDNKREGIYLLNSHRNRIVRNVLRKNEGASILVKHSDRNMILRNLAHDGAVQVRGDSTGNRFSGNYLKNNGYLFTALEEPAGVWTYPHGNRMSADCVRKTSICFRFQGAYDNVATNMRVGAQCLPPDGDLVIETVKGGVTPSGNDIEVADTCNDDPFWAR